MQYTRSRKGHYFQLKSLVWKYIWK